MELVRVAEHNFTDENLTRKFKIQPKQFTLVKFISFTVFVRLYGELLLRK